MYLNFFLFRLSPVADLYFFLFFLLLNAGDNMHNCARTTSAAATAILVVMLNADEYSEYFLIVCRAVFVAERGSLGAHCNCDICDSSIIPM